MTAGRVSIGRLHGEVLLDALRDNPARTAITSEAMAALAAALDHDPADDLHALDESIAWDPFRPTAAAVHDLDRRKWAESNTYRSRAEHYQAFVCGQFGRAGLNLADGATARAALMALSTVKAVAIHLLAGDQITPELEQAVAELINPVAIAVVRHVPDEVKTR